jgi:hypothetical protein
MSAPVTAATTPAERLARSRECLRQAMRDASAPRRGTSEGRTAGAGTDWLHSLKSIPGGSVLIEAVSSWWAQHPLRVAGMVAADAASAVVRPVAQRHPLGLVLGALVLGGVLAWSRPWRWILTPALFAGLLPQLFSKAMALVPPRSWMAVLTSLVQEQGRPPAGPPPGGQQAQASVH